MSYFVPSITLIPLYFPCCCTPSQILCLVHENNDLFLRYTNYESHCDRTPDDRPPADQDPSSSSSAGQVIVKLVPWFNEHGKVIQDVCFEPSKANERLLVLCDDNTLHIVPVLAIVQQASSEQATTDSASTRTTTTTNTTTIITSYVVPFVGPHECPNPRTCPNNFYRPPQVEQSLKSSSSSNAAAAPTLDELYSKQSVDRLLSATDASSTYFDTEPEAGPGTVPAGHNTDGIVCPYPTAVVWWQTRRRQDRAIVGYSDGSVCFLCKCL